jgi:hypothetical protein
MSKRTAVLCIYLVTAATGIAAIILPHAGSSFVALLIFAQTVLILGVVALLEQHPLPAPLVREMNLREVIAAPPPGDRAGKEAVATDGAPIHTDPAA